MLERAVEAQVVAIRKEILGKQNSTSLEEDHCYLNRIWDVDVLDVLVIADHIKNGVWY